MQDLIDPIKMAQKKVSLNPEQKEMIPFMFEALQKKGVVFVGQGPTGMGKTFVVAAVAKALVAQGKKVCIAVPTYAHLREVMGDHLTKMGVDYSLWRGLPHLEEEMGEGCPLKGGKKPSSIFCSDAEDSPSGPYSETCKNMNCTVKREIAAAESSPVVLTVFHKLISKPHRLGKFDITIFDESHGLEPALRSARVLKIRKTDLQILSTFAPTHSEKFDEVQESLEYLRRRAREEIPTIYVERSIVDPLKEAIKEVKEKIIEAEKNEKNYDESVENTYYSVGGFISAVEQRQERYRFVYHDEGILGIPLKITFLPPADKKTPKEISIALISATIESPRFHANDAGFQEHVLASPIQIQSGRLIRTRFKKRPIIGLVDGPILRKDPQFPESYSLARVEANKIIETIVPSFKYPILILCRSNEDAKSIESHLKHVKEVERRLYLLEDEDMMLDLDALQSKINTEIDKGRNIIVTTASSRLWEGANIKQLRMLIVDALPYPSPHPFEKFETGRYASWRTSRTFRLMIRKFQQGVGRLMRTDEDPWGICTVIDGRFNAQWRTIRSVLPNYMTSPEIIEFVTRDKLREELNTRVAHLENLSSSI